MTVLGEADSIGLVISYIILSFVVMSRCCLHEGCYCVRKEQGCKKEIVLFGKTCEIHPSDGKFIYRNSVPKHI